MRKSGSTPHTGGKIGKRHREGTNGKALCGRINVDIYPEFVLPDRKVDCPECQALLMPRLVACAG